MVTLLLMDGVEIDSTRRFSFVHDLVHALIKHHSLM